MCSIKEITPEIHLHVLTGCTKKLNDLVGPPVRVSTQKGKMSTNYTTDILTYF